jgi:hypothetical protein
MRRRRRVRKRKRRRRRSRFKIVVQLTWTSVSLNCGAEHSHLSHLLHYFLVEHLSSVSNEQAAEYNGEFE